MKKQQFKMLAVFSPNFAADTKIICDCNFVATLGVLRGKMQPQIKLERLRQL